jgi:hypothetical protein
MAAVLKTSTATVKRNRHFAPNWLLREVPAGS